MFGNPETTPGGRALKFYASVRLDIRRIDSIKQGTDVVGNRTQVRVVKNKVAPPFRIAEFDIMYNEGISQEGSLLDVAIELEIVRKSGAFFSFGDTRLGQGRENAKDYLRGHPEMTDEIERQIRAGVCWAHADEGGGGRWCGRGRGRPRDRGIAGPATGRTAPLEAPSLPIPGAATRARPPSRARSGPTPSTLPGTVRVSPAA